MLESGAEIVGIENTYVIDGIVGQGGFGVTYRAICKGSDEVVALKQIRLEKVESWKALELFEREASVLRTLSHARIPGYVDFFAMTKDGPVAHATEGEHAPQSLVLVQRLIAGADLQKRLALGESFEPDRAFTIVRDTLEVLAYLHALSPPVVHRDVNPKNIIVDEADTYLVDFGAIQQQLSQATVGGSTAVGTLGYMPIEQSLGKARPASDVYALGVTTVVLMTGMQPEQLPLDEATSKIDLAALGLVAEGSEQRKRLIRFLELALEPLVGQRLASARGGLDVLDGKDALVARPSDALAQPQGPPWHRTMFLLFLGGSLGGAGIIYPLNFDNFSEDQLVSMTPFWVLPAAFGAIGLMVVNDKNPIRKAFIGSLLVAAALVVFLFGIFPGM